MVSMQVGWELALIQEGCSLFLQEIKISYWLKGDMNVLPRSISSLAVVITGWGLQNIKSWFLYVTRGNQYMKTT